MKVRKSYPQFAHTIPQYPLCSTDSTPFFRGRDLKLKNFINKNTNKCSQPKRINKNAAPPKITGGAPKKLRTGGKIH